MVMREALLREHHRGGQSFIVVPRIADMEEVAEWLHKYVPEIKFVSAHGQMSPTEVEERMSAFYERRYEVLLSTTIVESGLDIPSANTIIIHRADRFGLAQLYQLRGRVGRAKLRAYAYLTTPKDTVLNEVAEKRLKVLGDLDSLGAGFQLASHDLDIRGAGNLLGDEQSGHIREVGFELYQSMLEDAILAAKAGEVGLEREREGFSPQITVDAPIMIPEDYVPDLAVRMALYRRLNDAEDKAEIESLAAEMIDRFGALPEATANLVKLIEIKHQAIEACIAKIDVGARGTLVSFHEDRFPDPAGLIAYVERLKGTARLRPDMKLVINRAWGDPQSRLNGLLQLTKGLSEIVRKAGKREKAAAQVRCTATRGPRTRRGPSNCLRRKPSLRALGLVVAGQLDDAPDDQAERDGGDDPHGGAARSARRRRPRRGRARGRSGLGRDRRKRQRQRGTRGNCISKHN